jgi:MtN3 and saliva related transmembrane protein
MYAAFTSGVALWFAYGVVSRSWPIILANAVTFVLAATILALKAARLIDAWQAADTVTRR